MNKIAVLSIALIFLSCNPNKKILELDYDNQSELNALLSIGANSTIRMSETTLDIVDQSNAIYRVREAITIYSKDDKDLARIVLNYNQFKKIDYIRANIRDNKGNLVRSFTTEDANDYSAFRGNFFSDNRVKVLELLYNTFPYTIEIEYQQSYSGLLNLPTWYPQWFEQSLVESSFTLIDRTETGVRYYSKNIDNEPYITKEEDFTKYKWQIWNQLPKKREQFGPPPGKLLPHVLVAPGKFVMDGTQGDATTWKNFGKWYYDLGKNTRELPSGAKKEIDELVSGIDSEREKVNVLFNYLQNKARYVSIQLGIGGWKPFSAEYVYDNSYGDCKALTNYMHAALEHVGIKAESVLIMNGLNATSLQSDFPSNQFNHVILRVTLENGEIIWLECTSKYLPINHIGAGNEGKQALLITKEGGELIRTPSHDFEQNRSNRNMEFIVNNDGSTVLNGEVYNQGILQDYLLYNIMPVSEGERVKWLRTSLNLDAKKIHEYDFSRINQTDEYAFYSYRVELNNYANISGKRVYIPVNKINKWQFTIPEQDTRSQTILFPYIFTESDSVFFKNPEGYEIETTPKDVEYDFPFGKYEAKFSIVNENDILFKRKFSLYEKQINPEEYNELKEFFDKVKYADAQNVVLVKK